MNHLVARFRRWVAWRLAPPLECGGCGDLMQRNPWIVVDGRLYHDVECFVYACEGSPLLRRARNVGAI